MTLDLSDEEAAALLAELDHIIDGDRYPLSPRIRTPDGDPRQAAAAAGARTAAAAEGVCAAARGPASTRVRSEPVGCTGVRIPFVFIHGGAWRSGHSGILPLRPRCSSPPAGRLRLLGGHFQWRHVHQCPVGCAMSRSKGFLAPALGGVRDWKESAKFSRCARSIAADNSRCFSACAGDCRWW
jgi:hypothetical protein